VISSVLNQSFLKNGHSHGIILNEGMDERRMSQLAKFAIADLANTDEILKQFAPMIRLIAQRLSFRLPPSLDVDDLTHAGIIGFLDALDRYDPTRKARFKTYAEFRIRGAMLDEIRAFDWVPRSVHDKTTRLRKVCEAFVKRHQRPPTEKELTEALEMSPEAFDVFLLKARGSTLLSLEDLGIKEGAGGEYIESLADPKSEDPLKSVMSHSDRNRLISAIEQLPEKERLVVSLYYHEELTMKEIGRVMSLTESRICQVHARAILKLKGVLGN
jgi:RNA polymerase sigma factor FliA